MSSANQPIRRLPKVPASALSHLREDPAMARAIDAVGPFKLVTRPATLDELCRAIIGQQLSVTVAASIARRFRELVGELNEAPPRHLIGYGVESLRGVGLSGAKVAAVHSLAEYWAEHELDEKRVGELADEELITLLTKVKGVGPWTVKMFLIFSLRRPNVLPQEDLGLRAGLKKIYGLEEIPRQKDVSALTRHWAPWSTVGTWYAWQFLNVKDTGTGS